MAAAVIIKNQLDRKNSTIDDDDDDAQMGDSGGGGGVPKSLRPRFKDAKSLPFIKKINEDTIVDITLEEVAQLFHILAPEEDGQIKLYLIRLLLITQLEDACSDEEVDLLLKTFLGKVGSKASTASKNSNAEEEYTFVSVADLHAAFTKGPGVDKFNKDRRIKRGMGNEIKRQDLGERLQQVTSRHDALVSLPITMIYVFLFVIIVMGHLRIFHRQLLENAMEEYINGRDPRETADANIDDLDSWWEWVLGAGTSGPLGNVKNSTTTGKDYFLLASRNMLIGDVRLTKTTFDGTATSVWLLKTDTAKAYMLANKAESSSTRYLKAARAAASHLQANGWSDKKIEIMELQFHTFNEYARMFGMTTVKVPLQDTGAVQHFINTNAVASEPYPDVIYLLSVDIIFFIIIFYIFVLEFKDALCALRLGCGEFKDYWAFWNCVDWVNILMTFSAGGTWGFAILAMRDPAMDALLNDDYKIKVDLMALTEVELDSIDAALLRLETLYDCMQVVFAANTATVVLKFFKAFSSNPRLMVVTNTFKVAGTDLMHFFIIFCTIFLPFTIIGHILFGSDVQEFASVVSSMNTGLQLMMGEFGWYVDIAPTSFLSTLPSGMPKVVLFLWYMSFMFLILLVLLNMLLAIIIERYTEVALKLSDEIVGHSAVPICKKVTVTKKAAPDPLQCPTIWAQVRDYMRYRKQTKKHVSLEAMSRNMENDEDPAHPGEEVSLQSLEDAFNMKTDQAQWIMSWLCDYLYLKGEKNCQSKSKLLEELAEKNSKRLVCVTEAVVGHKAKVDKLVFEAIEAKKNGEKEKEKKVGDDAKLADIFGSVETVIGNINKLRRDQDSLARRIRDLSGMIPAGGPKKVADRTDLPNPPDVSSSDKRDDRDRRDRDRERRDRDAEPSRDRDRDRGDRDRGNRDRDGDRRRRDDMRE